MIIGVVVGNFILIVYLVLFIVVIIVNYNVLRKRNLNVILFCKLVIICLNELFRYFLLFCFGVR